MSYCRFSTDDYRSDVYIYADVDGGFTTHVASLRYDGEIPSVVGVFDDPFDAQRAADLFKAQIDFLASTTATRIGGPFDGQTFRDPTLSALLARMNELSASGYRVPADAFAVVKSEIEEEGAADAA
jgi:hypothetical protein